MRADRLAAIVLVLCSAGCAAPLDCFEATLMRAGIARFERPAGGDAPGRSVVIQVDDARSGRGAVVSLNRVLTVAHVVAGAREVWVATALAGRGGWMRGRVVERIPSAPEPLVVLALDVDEGIYGDLLGFPGFSQDAQYRRSRGDGQPMWIATARGLLPWRTVHLRPGDSGSPVIDGYGQLLGLLSGRRGAEPVFAPLPREPQVLLAKR